MIGCIVKIGPGMTSGALPPALYIISIEVYEGTHFPFTNFSILGFLPYDSTFVVYTFALTILVVSVKVNCTNGFY